MRFHQLHEWFLSGLGRNQLGERGAAAGLANFLNAQKFYAGNASLLSSGKIRDFPRLPFPSTAVEFEVTDGALEPRSIILVAQEGEADAWMVRCFQKLHQTKDWLCLGSVGGCRGDPILRIRVNDTALQVLFYKNDAASLKTMQDVLYRQTYLLGQFLELLNCSNVSSELVPASAALNAKRARSGKPPVYSYKVLVLKRGPRLMPLGGTHASPRVHLRRGHIKKRKSGLFWWQPHAVGDKARGVVMKNYDASGLAEEVLMDLVDDLYWEGF